MGKKHNKRALKKQLVTAENIADVISEQESKQQKATTSDNQLAAEIVSDIASETEEQKQKRINDDLKKGESLVNAVLPQFQKTEAIMDDGEEVVTVYKSAF